MNTPPALKKANLTGSLAPLFVFALIHTGVLTAKLSKDTAPGPDPLMDQYYHREVIPLPTGEVMEIGSIALLPEKRIAVGTRRGDVWVCEGAYDADLSKVKWTLFFRGLHEPLGMFYKEGSLHFTDRDQYGKLTDLDNDGRADRLETLNDSWGINGDYHEYAFGSTPDKEGTVWNVLCLTGSFHAKSQWRGWSLRIDKDGKATPTCSGIRSPGGIGFDAEGAAYYTDNQGIWNGTSCLKPLVPGKFTGCPIGNGFYKDAPHMGPQPPEPKEGSRIVTERDRIPEYLPPAIQIPHAKVGQSPTAIITDHTSGKFGPFADQVLIGEQTHSEVQRVYLETVNGVRQGAIWKFLSGFQAGIVPMRLAPDGTLFVGGTNRGWASLGGKAFTLERARWKGVTPFEMKTMEATPTGFRLTFTEALDESTANDLKNYQMEAWTYIYQKKYGSPEVDQVTPVIKAAQLSADKMSVELTIEGLTRGHVHHLNAAGLRSEKKTALWHPDAYYTLNEIPKK